MPTKDSSKAEPVPCAKCGDDITRGRWWQAAIKSSEGGLGREPGSTPAGVGWYWVSVCTPCFWAHRAKGRGLSRRGALLQEEIA